jgi:hypothetical protein
MKGKVTTAGKVLLRLERSLHVHAESFTSRNDMFTSRNDRERTMDYVKGLQKKG